VNLRKAARAAIVVPLFFVACVVTDQLTTSLFGAFGTFAALVFADFGGPLRRRMAACLGLAVVGAALIAVGTAFADTIIPATVVTIVVAFIDSLASPAAAGSACAPYWVKVTSGGSCNSNCFGSGSGVDFPLAGIRSGVATAPGGPTGNVDGCYWSGTNTAWVRKYFAGKKSGDPLNYIYMLYCCPS